MTNANPDSFADSVPTPWVLYLAMLSIGMGQTVIYAVMPALGRELGLDLVEITLPFSGEAWVPGKLAITSLSAMTALVFAMVAPFWGRQSDRLGRKPIILVGLLGYTFGTLLFNGIAYLGFAGVLGGFALWFCLLLGRIAHACVMSATFPASNAYIVDMTPLAQRAKGLGRMSAANQLGVLMGPVMAAAVTFGFLTPLSLQALITFICAVLVYFFLFDTRTLAGIKARKKDVLPKGVDEQAIDGAISSEVLAQNAGDNVVELTASRPEAHSDKPLPKLSAFDARFRFILPVGFILYVMQGMVQQTLAFYCEDVIGLSRMDSVKYYATAMMASSMAMLFSQLVIVQRMGMGPAQLMRWGMPFCALGYAVIAATTGINGMLFGMMIFGLGIGMVMPGFSATASYTVTPREQGSLAGITGAIAGMGFVVGPLAGGVIYNSSYHAPFVIAAISIVLLSFYVVKNSRIDQVCQSAVE